MLKKYLMVALSCAFMAGSLRTEETNQSYFKRLWNSFTKKMHTIAQYGNEQYMATCGVCSLVSTATSLKLWLTRNDMVEHALRDAHGHLISNVDELSAWLQKMRANNAGITQVIIGEGFKKNKFFSTTGESFVHEFATKLEPITSDPTYKIFVGIAGITGLIALYSAYKLFTTPDKSSEVTQEN
jgi:hypothetical protein